jgi:RimJ/RimL family protein N-acetyltransferase
MITDDQKTEVLSLMEEKIDVFLAYVGYIPDDEDRKEIMAEICAEMSDSLNIWEPEPYDLINEYYDPRFDFGPDVSIDERIRLTQEILAEEAEDYEDGEIEDEPEKPEKELVPDTTMLSLFSDALSRMLAEGEKDGIIFPSYLDTLLVTETERLKIRHFIRSDLDNLWAIMKKSEVMYAWEHGFKKSETRKWLNQQLKRYNTDGYGYFAVTLKDSGKLIGQTGIIKSEINGEQVVELGYIFDNAYWGKGFGIEAARACVKLAFNEYGLEKLFCTVRLENTSSIRVAEKLGMMETGEYIKVFEGKEMPHIIYVLDK